MRIYADTSALIAWFHPADEFARAVTDWCGEQSPEFSWNALLRMELRHNLRRLQGKYAALAWHAYRASETSRKLKLELHRLSDLLERGDELSARHATKSQAGTWDFVHVAAALHVRSEVFITCDAAQAELARVAGLTQVRLFR
jgi:predicted nucleic acid-binding protein